ncbi:5-carboxymethyl-2-hydroxymuconate Delta-isomerase [Pseudomonas sp. NFXW11]|uniref:5-carboxymethyl-2-hydroxymuconate Delta-isomerase n=1 Tax=Pseudomonas sp. NFXW11 TaxID=2819531 RepID=UPI003CEF478A
MPHLHMEYTANLPQLDVDQALLRFNQALAASGQFSDEFDIKSRAIKLDHFRVGTNPGERAFIHLKLALLSGRSAEIKQQLSERLLAQLQELGPWPADLSVQLCVEIIDIDSASYSKAALGL